MALREEGAMNATHTLFNEQILTVRSGTASNEEDDFPPVPARILAELSVVLDDLQEQAFSSRACARLVAVLERLKQMRCPAVSQASADVITAVADLCCEPVAIALHILLRLSANDIPVANCPVPLARLRELAFLAQTLQREEPRPSSHTLIALIGQIESLQREELLVPLKVLGDLMTAANATAGDEVPPSLRILARLGALCEQILCYHRLFSLLRVPNLKLKLFEPPGQARSQPS
jgi:hypothetical protein